MTTLTIKLHPARLAIRAFSLWTDSLTLAPVAALGCSRNRGLCHSRIVSRPAIPGQINYGRPETLAIQRLNQPHSDLHFRFHIVSINPHRDTTRRLHRDRLAAFGPERDIVIKNRIFRRDIFTHTISTISSGRLARM